MALINCPNCSRNVSDKEEICPNCSYVFTNNKSQSHKTVKCVECGQNYNDELTASPNCGCSNSPIKQNRKKYKGISITIIVFVLIIVGILGFGVLQKAKEFEYYSNMKTASYAMLDGAVKAETAGNLINEVWYNAIFKKRDGETDRYTMENEKFVDDFNDALNSLFADENFINSIFEIKNNQTKVIRLMRLLKNPPKKYKEAYSVLKDYYDNYMKMTKAVINPDGSGSTFSENLNTYDRDVADSFEKMKELYLDE